ncbi:RNA polymerase sigma factor, partial [Streptococcus suis]
RKRQAHEINFSDLTPKEENQLYTYEDYFTEDKEEQTFFAGGKELSAKLIADAIHSFPEEKRRSVLLYYFFDMSDAEIAALYQIPRSTVQYRRTSSFELLKRYLEEHAYDCHDW